MTDRAPGGMLPTDKQLFWLGAIQGGMAYREAQRWAAQGVDPELAAYHGIKVSNAKLGFWTFGAASGFFAFIATGAHNGILNLWGVGQILLLVLLFIRLQTFLKSSPTQHLRYRLATGWLITAGVAWLLVLLIGLVSWLATPNYPTDPMKPATTQVVTT